MLRFILSITFVLFSVSSYAAPMITVHGILKSYTTKTIKIKTKDGLVTVPRSSAKTPLKGLVVGSATIQAQVSIEDMIKYNGMPKAEKKAK